MTVIMQLLPDIKGGPELQAGDGPEEGHVASPGTPKHRALPRRPCQERDGLQQIQGRWDVLEMK